MLANVPKKRSEGFFTGQDTLPVTSKRQSYEGTQLPKALTQKAKPPTGPFLDPTTNFRVKTHCNLYADSPISVARNKPPYRFPIYSTLLYSLPMTSGLETEWAYSGFSTS